MWFGVVGVEGLDRWDAGCVWMRGRRKGLSDRLFYVYFLFQGPALCILSLSPSSRSSLIPGVHVFCRRNPIWVLSFSRTRVSGVED